MATPLNSGKLKNELQLKQIFAGMLNDYCGVVKRQSSSGFVGNYQQGQLIYDTRTNYADTNPFQDAKQIDELTEYINYMRPDLIREASVNSGYEKNTDEYFRYIQQHLWQDEDNNIFNADYRMDSLNVIGYNQPNTLYSVLCGCDNQDFQ